ncbi:MAG TPA: hypothetical protein VHW23_01745 [Kofleriaceae bacterium]|jgi:hypothetical protein|nr:hypothetical protein [Kofleriaceae bacterium]
MVHEGVIALVRDNPAFAASLLRDLLHVEVPRFRDARLSEAALSQLVPVEYHADAVVLFDGVVDEKTRPVLGTIFEVQLERKDRKRYTWPLYAVAARARHECPFILIVVTPDRTVARWADEPIELGNGSFVPCVIGPQDIPKLTDREQAMREPQLAVLSVVAHGNGDFATAVSIGRAAVDASLALPEDQRVLYSALIEKALSEAARKALAMEPHIEKFFSEAHRRSYANGEAKGKADGEAKALLMILQRRGLAVTDAQQRQILSCTDLPTLDRWLDRVLSVASVDELLA